MNIAKSELEHLREEVKNCHRIIKDLRKKREFVGLTDEEYIHITDTVFHTGQGLVAYYKAIEAKLKEKNNAA